MGLLHEAKRGVVPFEALGARYEQDVFKRAVTAVLDELQVCISGPPCSR